jgi:hypothetical protein
VTALGQLEHQAAWTPPAVRAAKVTDHCLNFGTDRHGCAFGACDRSARLSIPPSRQCATHRCTVCGATPNRSATSVAGLPSRTSRTARYLCSTTFTSRSIAGVCRASCEATVSHICESRTMSSGQCRLWCLALCLALPGFGPVRTSCTGSRRPPRGRSRRRLGGLVVAHADAPAPPGLNAGRLARKAKGQGR